MKVTEAIEQLEEAVSSLPTTSPVHWYIGSIKEELEIHKHKTIARFNQLSTAEKFMEIADAADKAPYPLPVFLEEDGRGESWRDWLVVGDRYAHDERVKTLDGLLETIFRWYLNQKI